MAGKTAVLVVLGCALFLSGGLVGYHLGSTGGDRLAGSELSRGPSGPSGSETPGSAINPGQGRNTPTMILELVANPEKADRRTLEELLDGRSVEETVKSLLAVVPLSDDKVMEIVGRMTRIKREDVPANMTVPEFAALVARRAAAGIVEPEPENREILPRVEFAERARKDNSPEEASEFFARDASRIYACFDTNPFSDDQVLIKWYKQDDPSMVLFQKHSIDPTSQYNYVWAERKNGWPAGDYAVEVYSLSTALEPLARGSYQVPQ